MKKLITIILAILLTIFSAQAQCSEGTATAHLEGRSLVGNLPKLTTSAVVEGTVVLTIKVDQYGNVTEAIAGAEGTSITNNSVWNAARSAALRTHFDLKADSPALQTGTITYTFVSSGLADTDETALKFVGVPIGGSKEQMVAALKEKGFHMDYNGSMSGMFNGENVNVYISTNHGIVDRITVEYPFCSEDNDTRVKYNVLLSRFGRNAKYVCINPRADIPANESIYRKLYENTKYYDAIYFYLNPEVNAKDWVEEFRQEYLRRHKKPLQGLSYEEMEEALFCLPMRVSGSVSGVVWFTIVDTSHIEINYINYKNRPRGEDL